MARKKNEIPTEKLTISTTRPIIDQLAKLVRTSYYGKNPAEAAERLIAAELERLFGAKVIEDLADEVRAEAEKRQ